MNVGTIFARRKRMRSGLWMLGLPLVILAAACGESFTGPTETRDDSFVVGESPSVVVSGGNGSITVNPGTDGTVRVQATLRKPDDVEYEIAQEGNTISVEATVKRRGFFNFGESPGAEIEVTAPPNTRVELRTSNGRVEVHGMHQSGTVRTSNGAIVVEDVTGDFDISTSNGGVSIARARGTFDVETSNGRIEFDGELASGGDNRMTTSNGSVEIRLQGTPSVQLDASSSNGSVTTRLPILTKSPGDERHVEGTIGAGDAELFVRTSNGSVMVQ
jgi:DUF4097 and DUF4098 domain-containing protein YvlB